MAVATPAEKEALDRDLKGPPASGQVNYASVSGGFIIPWSQPSWHSICHTSMQSLHISSHKQSHEDALKRIGRYLKGMLHNSLILNPSNDLKIDCYPDA